MDAETIKKIGLAAGGILAGALGYHLIAGPADSVYTGLTREYEGPKDKMAAAVWALPEQGYEIRFEALRAGLPVNAFPDFVSPVFTAPFAAAVYADDIAEDLGYTAVGVWAHNANQASKIRENERRLRST